MKNVKVNLSRKASDLIDLAKKVSATHTALGADSLISMFDMAKFDELITLAIRANKRSEKLHNGAEKATQERNYYLGIAEDQGVLTQGTLLSHLTSMRDILLALNKGREKKVGDYGFDVVINGSTKKTDQTSEDNSDKGAVA